MPTIASQAVPARPGDAVRHRPRSRTRASGEDAAIAALAAALPIIVQRRLSQTTPTIAHNPDTACVHRVQRIAGALAVVGDAHAGPASRAGVPTSSVAPADGGLTAMQVSGRAPGSPAAGPARAVRARAAFELDKHVVVHPIAMHPAPGAVQMPQLSLQQTSPGLQVTGPHCSGVAPSPPVPASSEPTWTRCQPSARPRAKRTTNARGDRSKVMSSGGRWGSDPSGKSDPPDLAWRKPATSGRFHGIEGLAVRSESADRAGVRVRYEHQIAVRVVGPVADGERRGVEQRRR